jgi:hypothetical protein
VPFWFSAATVMVKRLFWKLCRLTSSPYCRALPAAGTNTVPSPPRPLVTAFCSAVAAGWKVVDLKLSMKAELADALKLSPKPQLPLTTSSLVAA